MVELGTATSDADFEDVYEFWYDIYVAEMGRHIHDANTSHQYRRLFDPLATAGLLCVARHDGKVVGTVLSTPLANPATSKYRSLYGLSHLSSAELSVSGITTKFMVAPAQRLTRLPLRLAFATYNWGLQIGCKYGYIDCNDHLLKLFTRLGYSQHLPNLHMKEYGLVNSLRLDITDAEHLRRVESPLLPILRRFQREQGLTKQAQTGKQALPKAIVEAFENYRPQPKRAHTTRSAHFAQSAAELIPVPKAKEGI